MRKHPLPFDPSPLDIRAVYARAKVYARFDLAGHAELRQAALAAAGAYPNFNHLDRCDLVNCPLLFADEPELEHAWARGAGREQQALAWMAEELREDAGAAGSAAAVTAFPLPVQYLFPDDAIPGMTRDELLALIAARIDDALDMTDGSDMNSDVRIDYAQDIIEQARDSLVGAGYEFAPAERDRLSFLTWPLTPEQEQARAAEAEREAADNAAWRKWRDATEAKFNRYLVLAMNGEALPPEADFTGIKIDVGWSSWTSSHTGETTLRPSGAEVGQMLVALIESGCGDARIPSYGCSRVGVTFETDPGPAWKIDFSVPATAEAWQLLRRWWDEHRIEDAPYIWYREPGAAPGRYCHWSLPNWPERAAPEHWRYGHMGVLPELA
jgi:hypothetical protein